MFPFDDVIMSIISNMGPEQDGLHIDHIVKCIFQSKKYVFWFLWKKCRYFDETKLSSLPVPEFVGFFTTGVTANDKIYVAGFEDCVPAYEILMLKVALTCLNYIVPE